MLNYSNNTKITANDLQRLSTFNVIVEKNYETLYLYCRAEMILMIDNQIHKTCVVYCSRDYVKTWVLQVDRCVCYSVRRNFHPSAKCDCLCLHFVTRNVHPCVYVASKEKVKSSVDRFVWRELCMSFRIISYLVETEFFFKPNVANHFEENLDFLIDKITNLSMVQTMSNEEHLYIPFIGWKKFSLLEKEILFF